MFIKLLFNVNEITFLMNANSIKLLIDVHLIVIQC